MPKLPFWQPQARKTSRNQRFPRKSESRFADFNTTTNHTINPDRSEKNNHKQEPRQADLSKRSRSFTFPTIDERVHRRGTIHGEEISRRNWTSSRRRIIESSSFFLFFQKLRFQITLIRDKRSFPPFELISIHGSEFIFPLFFLFFPPLPFFLKTLTLISAAVGFDRDQSPSRPQKRASPALLSIVILSLFLLTPWLYEGRGYISRCNKMIGCGAFLEIR